jgi:FAD/FMN-containing dehydrogenase
MRGAAVVTEHPMGASKLYDGVGSLIAYEDGEGTLGIIVENTWQRFWTEERSLASVVWNDGHVSKLNRQHVDGRQEPGRTRILIREP